MKDEGGRMNESMIFISSIDSPPEPYKKEFNHA